MNNYFAVLKMGHFRLLFAYFWSLQTLQLLQQQDEKNVQQVSSAGIRTHDLLNTSLLP